jgi:hypothetical protein
LLREAVTPLFAKGSSAPKRAPISSLSRGPTKEMDVQLTELEAQEKVIIFHLKLDCQNIFFKLSTPEFITTGKKWTHFEREKKFIA